MTETNRTSSTCDKSIRKQYPVEYRAWYDMWLRCTNPKRSNYKFYGARGVAVCDRWKSFEAFLEDMGAKPGTEYSLDRKSGARGYEPDNCRWGTRKDQNSNRRNNWIICFGEIYDTLSGWSRRTGIPYATLQSRLLGRKGRKRWSIERALTTPVQQKRPTVK